MFKFRSKCHWNSFLSVQLTVFHHWSANDLAPNGRQASIWNNDGLCCRLIYASLGLDELSFYVEQSPCHHLNQSSTLKCICIPRPLWIDITLYTNWIFSLTNRAGKSKHISKFLFYTLQYNCGIWIVIHYDNSIKPRQIYSPQQFINSYDATTKMEDNNKYFYEEQEVTFLEFYTILTW